MQTEEIASLAVSLSLEAQSFEKKMSSINKSIKNAERDFKSAGKGVEGFEKTFIGLDAKIKKTEKQLDLYNKKLIEQKEQYKKVQSDLVATKTKLDELEITQGKSSDAWKKQAQLVQKNAQDLVKLSTDINATEADIKKLTNELNNAQKEFKELGNETKTLDEKLEDISEQSDLTKSNFDKLGSELEQTGKYFQKLANDMGKLSSEIDSNKQKIDAYESEINSLNNELDSNRQEHQKLKEEIEQVEKKLNNAKVEYGENSKEVQQLSSKLLGLKDDFSKLETEINSNTQKINKYQTELNNTIADTNKLSSELRQMPFDEIGEKAKDAGDQLQGLSLFFGGMAAASIKSGGDASNAMGKIKGSLGETTVEAEKTFQEVQNLAKNGFDFDGATESIILVKQTMSDLLSPGQMEDFAGDVMSLCNIFELDFNEVIRTSSLMMRNFKIDGGNALDIIAYGLQNGLNVSGDWLDTLWEYSNQFSSMGFTAEETLAIINSGMKDGAFNTDKLADGVKEFNIRLSEVGKDQESALSSLGLNVNSVTNAFNEGGEAGKNMALKVAMELMKVEDETERNRLAVALFGTQYEDVGDAVVNSLGSIKDSNLDVSGSMEDVRQAFEETFGARMSGIINSLKEPLMELGESLLPLIEDGAELATSFAEWFSELDEGTVKSIANFLLISAALSPVFKGVGSLVTIGGNLSLMLGGVTGKTTLLSGAMSVLSGPVGIGLLIGVLTSLISTLGENENKLSDLQEDWGLLGEVIGYVCEHISGTTQLTIGNIGILISTLGKSIMAIISGDFKSIDEIWSQGWAKIENNTAKASSNINQESTKGIALLREMTEVELNNLTNTFDISLQKLPQLTADNASEMANTFVTRMQGLDQDTLTILRGTSDTMAVLFEGIKANMSDDEAHKKFTANLESMAKSGEFTTDKISQDISNAMNLIDQNVMDGSGRVKNSAQEMFDGIASISQFGMDNAVSNIVSSVNNMSDETIQSLSAMGGHWEALFGGIALTGKDAVADMDSHIRGRLQELAISSPGFISEMETQMSQYFAEINYEGTSNANELSANVENALSKTGQSLDTHTKVAANNVDLNTKSAANSAKINMNSAEQSVSKSASNMAKEAKKGTGAIAQNTDTDMKQANKSVQQSATDMYNGASKSYSKLKDNAKRDMTDMYQGTKTSAEKAASSAKSAATDMYKGVTTSTNKMANEAISDWNRIRNAYSRSIKGSVTMTKTTINKTEKARLTDDISPIQQSPASMLMNDVMKMRVIPTSYSIYNRDYNRTSKSIVPYLNVNEKSKNDIMLQIYNQNKLIEKLIEIFSTYLTKDIEIPVNLDGKEITRIVSRNMAIGTRRI